MFNKKMTESPDKLIWSEIKGRTVTYYLTTEEDLQNVRSNSLMGDIFFCLASLTAGGIISVILTRATSAQLSQQTTSVLNILLWVFICGTIILGLFAAWFHYQSHVIIKRIKGSGAVKSLRSEDRPEIVATQVTQGDTELKGLQLEILKAEYWTPKAKLDVAEELRKKITENRIDIVASNKIRGDPDYGTPKKMTVDYKINGTTITKEFDENDRVIIP